MNLMAQAMKAQKDIRSLEQTEIALRNERNNARVKRMDEFQKVCLTIREELNDLIGAPLDHYYWGGNNNWNVQRCKYRDFECSYLKRDYRHEREGHHNISEDLEKNQLRKAIQLINGYLTVTVTEINGIFVFELDRNCFHLLEVTKGLDVKEGYAWKEPLNQKIEKKFTDVKSLVKEIKEFVLKIVNIEELEERATRTEMKTDLAEFLKTEIAKIEITEAYRGDGVKFKVNGKGEYIVLKRGECEAFHLEMIKTNTANFFDLELAAEYSEIGLQDWANIKKNVTAKAFNQICSTSLGNKYTEAYSKKHGFTGVLAPFGNYFVVDCSKL